MTQEEFHKRYQYNPSTDCLGEGGFGKVYKAYDKHRDRYVAIKMAEVKPHLEEVRLKKEVEMISKLPTHPNIAYYEECYSFATFAGEYDFGILQYYEEGNLQQLVHSAQLTDEQKESILRQIMDGIAFLHQQGIIHRDLKPQNILIVNRNGEYIPKITDFGISKQLDASHSSIYTNSLSGAGTLAFASPEQLCGQEIRKNTDLWSFGVIASWLFSSKLPFSTSTQIPTNEGERIELYKQITKGEIGDSINHLPSNWLSFVKQCLIVDCDKRIVDASCCVELLDGKSIKVNSNTQISEPKDTPKQRKKNRSFTFMSPIKATWLFVQKWKIAIIAFLIITMIPVGLYLHWDYKYHYGDATDFSEGLAAVKKGDKWGFIDRKGCVVIPYLYDEVVFDFNDKFYYRRKVFHEGLALVLYNKKWCFIDKQGNVVFTCKYEVMGRQKFKNGLLSVAIQSGEGGSIKRRKGWKYGFINKKGEIVSSDYDEVRDFSDGLAAVRKGNRIGYIDTTGNEVIKCNLIADMSFEPDFIGNIARIVKCNSTTNWIPEYGYINQSGETVLNLNPDEVRFADNFHDGFALVLLNSLKYVMIDKTGHVFKILKTDGLITGFVEGTSIVKKDEKIGFLNNTGVQFVDFKYISAYDFSEGFAAVMNESNKWGFINNNGAEITPLKYDVVKSYSDGLAAVAKGFDYENIIHGFTTFKWGYIDEMGKEVIPCQFNDANPFSEGFARVKNSDKNGYYFIDKNGKTIGTWY